MIVAGLALFFSFRFISFRFFAFFCLFFLLVAHHLIFDKLLRLFADLAAAAAVAVAAAQIDWLPQSCLVWR